MDNCRHVTHLKLSSRHSVLNPERWRCDTCYTTESVWACLGCMSVACGRYNQEHALKHYQDTKHPLAIEVNDKYVFCYECDDYVLNDNAGSDISILRSALSAVASQSYSTVTESKGRRLLRSQSFHCLGNRLQAERHYKQEDIGFTVVKFRRYYILAKAFSSWKSATNFKPKPHLVASSSSKAQLGATSDTAYKLGASTPTATSTSGAVTAGKVQPGGASKEKKRRAITPGNTGLRNLGNTCYMNSILQALSHLKEFREYFITTKHLEDSETKSCNASSGSKLPGYLSNRETTPNHYQRQSTIECFQYVSSTTQSSRSSGGSKSSNTPGPGGGIKGGGLNGGGSSASTSNLQQNINNKYINSNKLQLSLYQELHALLRVMWSGKWALVSPHKMLDAVWQLIPFFKGYTQQDAQEFLCELLNKIQSELHPLPSHATPSLAAPSSTHTLLPPPPPSSGASSQETTNNTETQQDVIDSIFQGQLISEVTCMMCGHTSQTYEPFMDLSLEFPDRYQPHNKSFQKATDETNVEEMLSKFTETERLDGKIFACSQCNKHKRRNVILTEAKKKISIYRLPKVLRLHLKRFIIPKSRCAQRPSTPNRSTTGTKSSSTSSPLSRKHSASESQIRDAFTVLKPLTSTPKQSSMIAEQDNSSVTLVAADAELPPPEKVKWSIGDDDDVVKPMCSQISSNFNAQDLVATVKDIVCKQSSTIASSVNTSSGSSNSSITVTASSQSINSVTSEARGDSNNIGISSSELDSNINNSTSACQSVCVVDKSDVLDKVASIDVANTKVTGSIVTSTASTLASVNDTNTVVTTSCASNANASSISASSLVSDTNDASIPTTDTHIATCTPVLATQISTTPASVSGTPLSSRWSGRNHRGKINVHVAIESCLDFSPYLYSKRMRSYRKPSFTFKSGVKALGGDVAQVAPLGDNYVLKSVVMHHGRGFGSGHYTAYCYNEEAESWVHYNDDHVTLCSLKEVLSAQAYILFYERVDKPAHSESNKPARRLKRVDDDVSFMITDSEPKLKRMKSTKW